MLKKVAIFAVLLFVCKIHSATNCSYEGERFIASSTVQKCVNGHWTLVSCLTKSGLSIDIGEYAPGGNVRFQCKRRSNNTAKLVPVSCSINGHDLNPGENYTDDKFFYSCFRKNDNLLLEVVSCIGTNFERIPFGGAIVKDRFLYKCVRNGTSAYWEPYGCIYYDNKHYVIGEKMTDDQFWAVCERNGNTLRVNIKGCLDNNGNFMNDGDTYRTDSYIVKCTRNGNEISRRGVGCLEKKKNGEIIEHYAGEKWIQTDPTVSEISYLKECQKSEDQIVIKTVKCTFLGKNSVLETHVEPGCMKKVNKRLMICISTNNGVQARLVDNASAKDEKRANTKDGVENC